MTVIKTTITSVNSTLQKVDQNEKVLKEGLNKLLNYSSHQFNKLEEEIRNINLINEQFRLIQRGIDESQHSFETLINAFVHAAQGTLQPQLNTSEKIRNLLKTQKLPSGMDYPNFPFSELQKIIIPNTYSYKQYLVYILRIPLFSPTEYHLYKMLPFPVAIREEDFTYSYISFNKEYIFSDSLRQHYGKMSSSELIGCFQPNELMYVCKEDIPIYTYIPDIDCEATLLHPSTTKIPNNCEHRIFKLRKTFWIPLHWSNQWLFVAPQTELFAILCPQETTNLRLQNEGKLTLQLGCKGYSSYVTLYAASTIMTNVTSDYIPIAPVDFDCCFESLTEVNFERLPLQVPLVNILSSVDELKVASMKAEDVEQLIKEQERKINQNLYVVATSWGAVLGTISLLTVCICCSCCFCKCCRNCFFWIWSKWTPKDCWRQTQEKCCVSIYNYNGSRVEYSKTDTSPAASIKSLPELRSIVSNQPEIINDRLNIEKETESISMRTRSKKMFR
jgi:hypothetical protein